MCKFKYCEGPHACFLRDISPCPRTFEPKVVEGGGQDDEARLRSVIRGFLDREELVQALGLADAEVEPEEPANVGRVTSKLKRAVEVLGLRQAS